MRKLWRKTVPLLFVEGLWLAAVIALIALRARQNEVKDPRIEPPTLSLSATRP